jgi:chemotaxis protein MotB
MAKTNSIIIKRVKKVSGGAHGGAWKVAYADFVTAMMAFFLLLWLLNATTDAQKRGIADYFQPTIATKSTTSGAGGVLSGRTMASEPGSQAEASAPVQISVELNQKPDIEDSDDADTPGKVKNPNETDANGQGDPNAKKPAEKPNGEPNAIDVEKLTPDDKASLAKAGIPAAEGSKLTDQQLETVQAAREERQFKTAEFQLHQAIQAVPDLKPLEQNLVVERTPQGLRIQLVDQDKTAMFPTGSSDPDEAARKLMTLVSRVVSTLPNKIAITGHTDSTPYRTTNYDNYDLSIDRARSMRHALMNLGTAPDRIATVEGKGDTEPFLKNDPTASINRRISIVLLREFPPTAPAGSTPGAVAPAAASPAQAAPPVPKAR